MFMSCLLSQHTFNMKAHRHDNIILMLEFFGKSLITPLTVKFCLLSATITLPIGVLITKEFFSSFLGDHNRIIIGKGFDLLPLIR